MGVLYGVAGVVQVAAGVASLATQAVRSPSRRLAFAIWVSNVQVVVGEYFHFSQPAMMIVRAGWILFVT